MSLDHFVSVFSAAIAFVGLFLVAVQMRNATRQREADSLVRIYDTNRELLSLGFSHPPLFAILQDAEDVDPVWERRYLQLWLNHLSLLHFYLKRSVFHAELVDSETRALAEFMTFRNMRRHWQENGEFYPESFQKRVNAMIEKGEPPRAAHHDSTGEHLPGDAFKRGPIHPHERFPVRGGEHAGFVGGEHEALDEHVAVIGKNRRRTGTPIAQLGKLPVFPNNSLDSHNVIFRLSSLLKQNYAKCFNPGWGGAFV